MSTPARNPAPVFFIGLFFGLLIGWFLAYVMTDTDTGEAVRAQPQAQSPHGAGEQPPPQDPHQGVPPGQGAHAAGPDRAQQSFAKVHFMKKFVKALTQLPGNEWPSSRYEPLLKDPANPLRCTDCHDPQNLNVESMLRNDPGHEAVEPYRRRPTFMVALMKKWVARLNQEHADRLAKPVTCTDCHGIDPEKAWSVLPPFMVSFVNALKEKPKNRNPATNWKPLVKEPETKSMLCSVCHGEVGKQMELNVTRVVTGPPSEEYHEDKVFMIDLMEHWVAKLNRKGKEILVKKVGCLDCHETDPRK